MLGNHRATAVLTDEAYDTNAIRAMIADAGMIAVNLSQGERKVAIPHDKALYKQRNRIERCVNKLRHFRCIATRLDRRDIYLLAFIHIAAALIRMR